MRDLDIRLALRPVLQEQHRDEPGTLILEEMGLCQGATRVDVAVINGAINGFEIKSDKDSLERLPRQVEIYSRTLDYVTLVVGRRHLGAIYEFVPPWWGIVAVTAGLDGLELHAVRDGSRNPGVDAHAVAQLLWRNEALEILEDAGLARGLRSKPRAALWSALAEGLEIEELATRVRETLKARSGWQAVVSQTPDDGSCPPCATSSRFQTGLLY